MEVVNRSITEVSGVSCSSAWLGIKRDEIPDAALFALREPATYAGVFTLNQFRSACVDSAMERLHGGSKVKAVLITSGNANAGTGVEGRADTEMLAEAVSDKLSCQADEVIVLHTGVIGVPLRAQRLLSNIPSLVAALSPDTQAGIEAARAMMTTDTFPKTAIRQLVIAGVHGTIAGVAKGAGMIHPRLATMLSVIITDFTVSAGALQQALQRAMKTSFNAISVDGDTSPNDSVILLATGKSEGALDGEGYEAFCESLTDVCEELAQMIVRDGEGATKFIEIHVNGAASESDADKIASTIATSPLVKTAFFGEDFNPGRIISAIGRAGVNINLAKTTVSIGGLRVFGDGVFENVNANEAERVMAQKEIVIDVDLHAGDHDLRFFTCDLSYDYVRINGEYTT